MKTISTQFALELLGVSMGCSFSALACFLGATGVNPLIIGIALWFGWFLAFFIMAQASTKLEFETVGFYVQVASFMAVALFIIIGALNLATSMLASFLDFIPPMVNFILDGFTWTFGFVTSSLLLYVVGHSVTGRITRTGLPRGF